MSTLRVNKIQPNSKEAISIDGNVNITGSLVHNGHTTLAGTNVLSGSTTFIGATTVEGDLTVGGTLTAQEVRTEFDNASVVFESGSTKFGNSNDDTHSFTGSMTVEDGVFKVTHTGDDVLVATPGNGTFVIGDTQELGDGARISGDSTSIKVVGSSSKTVATFNGGQYFTGIGTNNPNGTFHISHPTHAQNNTIFKVDNNGSQQMTIDASGEFSLGDKGQNGDGGYIAHDSETFQIYSIGGTKVADFSLSNINFTRNLHIKAADGADATITLESDLSNVSAAGDNDNPAILFKQDGGSCNAAIGFNIIDDTAGGTIPGTGNRFWIVNSMDDTLGAGGITFGTAQEDGWDNARARFMIRGDGKGLFGHPNANYTGSFDSQFEIYDDRTENTTSDYTLASYGLVDIAGGGGVHGAGGIISRLKIVNGAADVGTYAISLVPGASSSEIMASGDLAFYAGSTMDTSNATGFAGFIHGSSGNWQIGGKGATDADTGYKLTVSGSTRVGDLDVQGTLTQANSINFSTTACGIVWAMNTDGASIRFYNSADADADSRLEFNTRDNNNEYFKWTHSTAGGTYESMRLDPIKSGSNSKLTVNGDFIADSLTIGNSTNVNNMVNYSSSIAGGANNTMNGPLAFIGSGCCNQVDSYGATIVGGHSNRVSAQHSNIGGGLNNNIPYGQYSAVVGGQNNNLCAAYSSIGGGISNSILLYSDGSAIVGGISNTIPAKACYNFIGGGATNKLIGSGSSYSAIVGGRDNQIWGAECGAGNDVCYAQFIGGGCNNKTKFNFATVAGGCQNIAAGASSIVAGGQANTATSTASSILGGTLNIVQEGVSSTVVAGQANHVSSSTNSSVVGGHTNRIKEVSNYSSILGGCNNELINSVGTSIVGGTYNKIDDSDYSSILGGHNSQVIAGSTYSSITAAGEQNKIDNASRSVIGGGAQNTINGDNTQYGMTIAGGCYNFIGGGYNKFGTIGGGHFNNIATSCYTTIGGGCYNTTLTHAHFATISGGECNKASCWSFIGGGFNNKTCYSFANIAGGQNNTVSSPYGSILGGRNNTLTAGGNGNSIVGTEITTPAGITNSTFANNLILTGSSAIPNSGILSLERLDTTPSTLIEGSIFHSGSAGAGCLYFSPDGSTIRQIAFV
jgi:hypothetical protein